LSAALGEVLHLVQKPLRLRLELVGHKLAGRLPSGGIVVVAAVWGLPRLFHRGVDIVGAGNFRVRAISECAADEAVDNGESCFASELKTLSALAACVDPQ
jgi:hypothetical protein